MSKTSQIVLDRNSAYYESHKDAIKQYKKDWAKANKERIALLKKIHYSENKEEIIEQKRIYNNEKRATDVAYRLKANLRSRLNVALKRQKKSGSSIKDLGCSAEFLKKYLESKFVEGMSWENYGRGLGKWNIDHIQPLSNFNLSDPLQVAAVCHYTNLQPLWFEDNLKKSNKVGI